MSLMLTRGVRSPVIVVLGSRGKSTFNTVFILLAGFPRISTHINNSLMYE